MQVTGGLCRYHTIARAAHGIPDCTFSQDQRTHAALPSAGERYGATEMTTSTLVLSDVQGAVLPTGILQCDTDGWAHALRGDRGERSKHEVLHHGQVLLKVYKPNVSRGTEDNLEGIPVRDEAQRAGG